MRELYWNRIDQISFKMIFKESLRGCDIRRLIFGSGFIGCQIDAKGCWCETGLSGVGRRVKKCFLRTFCAIAPVIGGRKFEPVRVICVDDFHQAKLWGAGFAGCKPWILLQNIRSQIAVCHTASRTSSYGSTRAACASSFTKKKQIRDQSVTTSCLGVAQHLDQANPHSTIHSRTFLKNIENKSLRRLRCKGGLRSTLVPGVIELSSD